MFTRVLLWIACAAAACAQQAEAPKLRLGDAVRPLRYAVDLKLVPSEETFKGTVSIDLEVRRAAQTIWMHGKELTIESAALATPSGNVPARPVAAENGVLGFSFDAPVQPGSYRFTASYTGKVNSKSSDGIFRNQDRDEWYIYTQFEAIEARSALPCFDEPGFKTPWQLTLHIKDEHSAFSNTPIASETREGDGFKTVKFAETKPMPSYLIAFAAGPFEAVNAGTAGRNKTPLRIVVTKGRAAEAKWAVESTGPILTLLENYFNMPYPYEKLDSIAVPLFSGAMENPGLITYGLPIILANPTDDSVNRRRGYATIAAHEISHMWFGDLVTMEWWDDLWLNESFATWMGDKITAQFRPEWEWDVTDTSGRLSSMNADSLTTARRMRQPIESLHDIANAFDGITYGKGAAVLHMFEEWLGEDTFRRGVKSYLDRHSWGNATASDFLKAISTAAGRDIAPVFGTYLDQAGVPVVSVELKCAQGKTPALSVSQRRYLPIGSKAAEDQKWQIPLCFRYGDGKKSARQCSVLSEPAAEVPIADAKACPAWVLLNDEYNGYYRTLYKGDLLNRLLGDTKKLDASERLGIVRDMEGLVRSGDLMAGEALRLVPKFASDPNRHVLAATAGIAASINRHLVSDELRPNYSRFIQKSYGERARQLGWEPKPGEDDNTKLLRQLLVPLVADAGDDRALQQQGAVLGRKWIDDRKAVPSEMASSALVFAARSGDEALWQRMLEEAKKTKSERERQQLLGAMGSFRNPEIIRRNFELLLNGQFDLRQADALLFAPLQNPATRSMPYDYLKANYDAVAAKMPGGMGMDFRAFLPFVASGFCSAEKRDEVEQFFKERSGKITGGPRVLAQVLEQIGQCTANRITQQEQVSDFLRQY